MTLPSIKSFHVTSLPLIFHSIQSMSSFVKKRVRRSVEVFEYYDVAKAGQQYPQTWKPYLYYHLPVTTARSMSCASTVNGMAKHVVYPQSMVFLKPS